MGFSNIDITAEMSTIYMYQIFFTPIQDGFQNVLVFTLSCVSYSIKTPKKEDTKNANDWSPPCIVCARRCDKKNSRNNQKKKHFDSLILFLFHLFLFLFFFLIIHSLLFTFTFHVYIFTFPFFILLLRASYSILFSRYLTKKDIIWSHVFFKFKPCLKQFLKLVNW